MNATKHCSQIFLYSVCLFTCFDLERDLFITYLLRVNILSVMQVFCLPLLYWNDVMSLHLNEKESK